MRQLEELEKTEIKKIISDKSNIDLEKINDDSSLKDNLGIDSLDIVEIVMDLEEMFNCTIPYEDYEHAMTVKDVFKIVEQNL
jgi:acyl carrier protein